MRRLRKWALRFLAFIICLVLLLGLAFLIVLRTQWLREQIRTRIITEAEKATGGKVELSKFDFDPVGMKAHVEGFVLRGKEPANEEPLARVASIDVGVTVASFARRDVYLSSLTVSKPQIRIISYLDGTTNIPGPKIRRPNSKTVFEQFVALSVRNFVLKDGTFSYDHQRTPLDVRAENLEVLFGWEREGPQYRGVVTAKPFHFNWPKIAPLQFDTRVELTMDKTGLSFQKAEMRRGGSLITATGRLSDYRSPEIDVDTHGQMKLADWVKELHLPLSPEGTADFKGKFTYRAGVYGLVGEMAANNVAVREDTWQVVGASATGHVDLGPNLVTISQLRARALGGDFNGIARISDWRDFLVRGNVSDMPLEALQELELKHRPIAWSATMSGPVEISGYFQKRGVGNLVVAANTALQPREDKIPLEGILNTRYVADSNAISFASSYLKTPRTRVDFNGALGEQIRVILESSDLNEFLPAAAMVTETPPQSLPLQLDGGVAKFEGAITSPLDSPKIRGKVAVTQSVLEKRKFDSISGDLDVDASHLVLRGLRLRQASSQIEGDVEVALANWKLKDDSKLDARLNLRQTSIEELLKQADAGITVKGTASGPIQITGTLQKPAVSANLALTTVQVEDEAFPRVQFDMKYSPGLLEVTSGVAEHAAGRVPFRVTYRHQPDQYDKGVLTFDVSVKDAPLQAVATLHKQRPDLQGRADAQLNGRLQINGKDVGIDIITGTAGVRQLMLNKIALGSLSLQAKSQADRIAMSATGDLMGSPITGNGEWQLTGDANGLGHLELGSVTLARLNEILRAAGNTRNIPFDGGFHAEIVVSGPLRKPNALKARANLTELELLPRIDRTQIGAQVLEELKLKNTGPIVAEFDSKGLQIVQAHLTGKETNIQISGNLALGVRNAWNIALRGGLNLGIFQNYVPGLRTAGAAEVNASVRGGIDEPQLGGRAEIKNASVSHRDLTNSVEKANGVVVFDRNRALLQNFTAQSGGGEAKLSGFVTFGGEEEAITYRINGQLDRVRIRYPEGASTTVNANLSLTGTSDQSLLAGTVSVVRSGFASRTDLGSALLEPSKPVPTPTSSTFLRGMQFDVRVLSAPNLQIDTQLTRGMAAEVDLRLRGSPLKPVVLGSVSVTQGEVNFFGTTYRITRGTVSFFNAARIEPVLDLDLETVVRAVTVNMNVSGPTDKPNVTYRSDPPFQTSEIIALLAVGRTPTESTLATQTNVTGTASGLFAGTDTLLGQALSAGVGGRLQRFFGVSRVKIDPQLVGVDTTPQARLTIEQQISRDITLTYVTNLTGALQQLVRLQWDFQKNWSVTFVRDENGVVGGDILYRRRFK
jgi:translocation and assembly module TamB